MFPLVVLIDVDGTLVGRDDEVSEAAIRAIKELRPCSENIILSTGRQYERCLELRDSIKLYDYVIAADGSDIRSPDGNQIRQELLSIEELKLIFRKSKEHDVTLIYSAGDDNFISAHDDNVPFFLSYKDKMPFLISTNIDDFFETVKVKMVYVLDRRNSTELSQFVSKLINEGLDIRRSVPGYACVVRRGVSKASGYSFLRNNGFLTKNHKSIAIGDGENDIPLFNITDFSFCMNSASVQTRRMADKIVPSVENDGIVEAIHWILNNASVLKK